MNDCHSNSRFPIAGTHPGTISFIEAFPDVLGLFFGHPNPGILDAKLGPVGHPFPTNCDRPVIGKLDGVLDDIKEDLDEPVVGSLNP